MIDVGYSGVIGADKLMHGRELYGAFPTDDAQGDTYGPLLYLAYAPFELIWPWVGRWNDLPAAHAASAAFDLACVVLLFLIGRRIRGNELGVVLAYAWVAFPFTIYATNSGTNDALPAALVLAAIYAASRPFARGAFGMAAGLTKLAPLVLLPLLATHDLRRGSRAGPLLRFIAGAVVVAAFAAVLVLTKTDLRTFWDRTVGFQTTRDAPFSVWGYYGGGWEVAQRVVQVVLVVFADRRGVRAAPGRSRRPRGAGRRDPRRRPAGGDLLVLPLPRLGGAARADRVPRPASRRRDGARHGAGLGPSSGSRSCSIASARSRCGQRMSTAFIHGSSSAVSKRVCICVTIDSIACSRFTPITPPRGPVMPTSVM